MLCTFPVKSPPGCKISLYLHSSLFAININIGAEWLLFPIGKKLCCIWKQLLEFFFLFQINERKQEIVYLTWAESSEEATSEEQWGSKGLSKNHVTGKFRNVVELTNHWTERKYGQYHVTQ